MTYSQLLCKYRYSLAMQFLHRRMLLRLRNYEAKRDCITKIAEYTGECRMLIELIDEEVAELRFFKRMAPLQVEDHGLTSRSAS